MCLFMCSLQGEQGRRHGDKKEKKDGVCGNFKGWIWKDDEKSHFDMENIYVKSHWHVSKWMERDGEINFDDIFLYGS